MPTYLTRGTINTCNANVLDQFAYVVLVPMGDVRTPRGHSYYVNSISIILCGCINTVCTCVRVYPNNAITLIIHQTFAIICCTGLQPLTSTGIASCQANSNRAFFNSDRILSVILFM